MSEFTVDKSSWHYRWIAFVYSMGNMYGYGGYKAGHWDSYVEFYEANCIGRPYNFCMYWRHVLLYPAIRILFSIAMYGAGLRIAWLLLPSLAAGLADFILFVVLGVLALVIFSAAIFGVSALSKKTKQKAQNVIHGENFIGQLYKSYKNKYCPNILYKETSK